ncbi:MAG: universal stress protein [Chloroflexi bacterium]|nr:universal stress protein [Chloroflexota bacterium]
MYKAILITLDGSRASNHAIVHAEAIAAKFESRVVILRVIEPVAPPLGSRHAMAADFGLLAFEAAEHEMGLNTRKARDQLNGHRRKFEQAGITTEIVVESGDAAEIILKTARLKKIDLIVMSTRGRSGLKRAVLGSVADKVVRSAVAPVLLVRR